MKKNIRNLILALVTAWIFNVPSQAVIISVTITSQTITTPGASLLLNKNESLTYTLTGTATGQILIEKSLDGTNYSAAGVSVTGSGPVSTTGTLYSGDKNTYFRWRASTMTAGPSGSFVATIYDNDDVVQEFKNNKGVPIFIISDDKTLINGGLVATSATFTIVNASGGTQTDTTLSGAITVASGSTMTFSGTRIAGTTTDASTRTFAGASFNGTKADHSTTTYTADQTFVRAIKGNGGYASSIAGGSDVLDVTGNTAGTISLRLAANGSSSNAARIRATLNGTNSALSFLTAGAIQLNIDGNSGFAAFTSSMSAAGIVTTDRFQLMSRTKAALQALAPSTVGELYYCSNCTTDGIVVSTGTAAGAWARVSARTTAID